MYRKDAATLYHSDHAVGRESAGIVLTEFNLNGCVINPEPVFKFRGHVHEKGIAGMAARHHQMTGKRGIGRADQSYMQIMQLLDAGMT